MLDLHEAQERLLALAPRGATVRLPVEQALGHYLAEPLPACRTQPEHPLSAMDGWAVSQADLPGPWRIVGESAAGHPFSGRIGTDEAVRISTGAIVPDGSDMVLVQEDCRREGGTLLFEGVAPQPLARHIRVSGLDFTKGEIVLAKGQRITPARLALAISAGHAELPVAAPPKVAIIDSGDELRPAGEPLGPGQIPASNGPMLAAMLSGMPCRIERLGPIGDDKAALRQAFDQVADADIVITSGGASVGDHDLIQPVLEESGAGIDFWRVAIKPGKPIMVARRGGQLFLGLPGNPGSCFVTGFLFALPLLRAACGAATPLPVAAQVRVLQDLPRTGSRAEFLRASVGPSGAAVLGVQDSGALLPLAQANALVIRPPFSESIQNGGFLSIYRLFGPMDD
jgi:molybdopterin molybdotransferase